MIEHMIVYICDACGAKAEERYQHPPPTLCYSAILRYPSIPTGWQELRGQLICGAHVIEVTIT